MVFETDNVHRDFKALEELVAKIQKNLAPQSEVIHNIKLDGHSSRRKRQIDVLVRDKVGQYDILIVLECKDYKTPVDVKGVEEFSGLLQDVRAQKGVMVCPRGFTKAAKKRAQTLQIDLYSPVDTDIHKWTARVTMPALCDFRSAAMSFGIRVSAPAPFKIEANFFQTSQIFDEQGEELGTILSAASRRWSKGEFPTDVGYHEELDIFPVKTFADNGYGARVPVSLFVGLRVSADLYFGQYPIAKLSGFKDEVAGSVITNAFELGMLDPDVVEKQWKRLRSIEEAPLQPVIMMTGLISWME